MDHSYILSILYEMALVIGGEVSVKPLLTKMLQRLLYHTSFPAGFVCLEVPSSAVDSEGMLDVRIDAAVGDYELIGLTGQMVRLPAQLLRGAEECGEDAALLAVLPDKVGRYKAYLRLPIDGQGVVVLLAPQLPDSDLPLTQLFQPVMANLAKAILLCSYHDAYTGGLIAARDASQLALAASEEKFRAISTASLDALIMVDDTSALVYWNPAAERILGYRADEAIGKPLHQLLTPPRYQSKAIQGFDAFRNTGQGAMIGKTIEIEALHKDGREIPIELSISALMLGGHWHAVGILRDIAERKRAEETRTQLAAIVESSADAIIGKTPDGIITNWNKGAEKIYGYTADEIIGKPITMLAPPSSHAGIHELLEKVCRGETVSNQESKRIRKDGTLIHVSLAISPIRDASGNIIGISTVARDITEKKRTEEALRENERFLDSLIEHIPNMVFVKDAAHLNFVRFNKAGEELLGYSRDDLMGKNDYDFFPKEQADFFTAKDRGIIDGRELLDIPEELISTKFLGDRYLHTRKIPIFADDGSPLYLLGISDDITERKLAEEQLRRSERSLAEAQRIAHLGNWDLDLVKNVLTWSDEIYRIFEIDPEKFGASYEAFLNAIHPDDRELVNRAYSESVKNRTPYDIEHRLQMTDGRVKYVNEKCETHYDKDGKPLRSFGVVHDITERKATEEELRIYKDHLEEVVQQRTTDLVLAYNAAEAANRAKSVFLSSMSHELRTPLNAILGFSYMMRKDPLLSQEQRENLDIINRSGEHLLTLINDVLEMAKIEAGRVQLESAPFDLGGLVRDVTDMMHVRAQEKGLQLLIDQSSEFPRYIKGDEARLRQVLINLVGNAVKFTPQGGVTLRFGIKPHAMPQRLLIEVEDSGIGIKPEDQQKIFEPFVQLGQTATQKGTGLGLTLTRQFVQLMGGTVSVESIPGAGSTFRVELPVVEAAAADVIKPESVGKSEILSLAPGQPEYRILIVEDQLENQLLLANLMKNVGFPIKVAENGEQAVEIFQSWRPHLIWMDRRMPVMDGLEATRRIRDLPGGKEVKIAAVTASAFTEQRDEMLKAGMDDFVRKPYRFNEIYECLGRQLGVKYIYADARAAEAEEASDGVITAEMLTALPPDLRRELHDALESLEGERIGTVIQQTASYDPKLHKTLSHLAGNFDYPAILRALQANQ
ncbi:MAG: PAS domain S-box protein [Betaproteobacteria bacterium]|nr:PAS domain S-box protein [Betaproteobacteria bacterium]